MKPQDIWMLIGIAVSSLFAGLAAHNAQVAVSVAFGLVVICASIQRSAKS